MVKITLPDPVTLVDPVTHTPILKGDKDQTPDDPWDMARVLARFVYIDKALGLGRLGSKLIARVNVELAHVKDNVLTLDTADYDKIIQVINNPTEPERTWPPGVITAQLEVFFVALDNAVRG